MEVNAKFVGCRINCYLYGFSKLGFSIPIYGWANPSQSETKLWHFPIKIRIVETKYHFDIDGDKLLSFSVRPLRSNTEAVFEWLKTLDNKRVKIKNYKETEYWIPYFEKDYHGEIYPEDSSLDPAQRDYRDQVEIV